MKKIIVVLVLLFTVCINSFSQVYRAYEFAYANISNDGNYTWSEWEKSDLTIKIDFPNEYVYIFSKTKQTYSIVGEDKIQDDGQGGKVKVYTVIDQDNDFGQLKLRIDQNNNSQLYVVYNNVAWVYSVIKIKD